MKQEYKRLCAEMKRYGVKQPERMYPLIQGQEQRILTQAVVSV